MGRLLVRIGRSHEVQHTYAGRSLVYVSSSIPITQGYSSEHVG